ncbi:MAG: hypothetical protein ACT4OK_11060 [Gemmobacter sp.]
MSRSLNAALGGDPDLTLCAQSWRDGFFVRPWLDWVFKQLLGEDDHCRKSWEWYANMTINENKKGGQE